MKLQWFILPLLIMPPIAVVYVAMTHSSRAAEDKLLGTAVNFEAVQEGRRIDESDFSGKTWVGITSACTDCELQAQWVRTTRDLFKVYQNFEVTELSTSSPAFSPGRAILVDRWGRVRGVFEIESERSRRKLIKRVKSLLGERF